MKTVLFLCTGNYYRSRYAEEVFNHRVAMAGIDWLARSRALAIERGSANIGPISPFAVLALARRGLAARGASRLPRSCAIADLEAADCIVALDEAEHRPLMQERFPQWDRRTEYWQIADVSFVPPSVALAAIDDNIDALLLRLRRQV